MYFTHNNALKYTKVVKGQEGWSQNYERARSSVGKERYSETSA